MVVPVYNEAPNLEPLVKEVELALAEFPHPWEIVLVDDGSTDGTPAILKGLLSDTCRAVALARNRGQSTAMEVGFRASHYDTLVTLDGDLQNDPADILRLLERLVDADVVCGVRARRQDSPWRRIASRVANAVRRRLTGDSSSDTGCTLKAFRGQAVDRLVMFRGGHRFLPALLQMEGFRVVEMPVSHRPRRAGTSKYGTLDRLRQTVPDLLAVTWMRSRYVEFEAEEL